MERYNVDARSDLTTTVIVWHGRTEALWRWSPICVFFLGAFVAVDAPAWSILAVLSVWLWTGCARFVRLTVSSEFVRMTRWILPFRTEQVDLRWPVACHLEEEFDGSTSRDVTLWTGDETDHAERVECRIDDVFRAQVSESRIAHVLVRYGHSGSRIPR